METNRLIIRPITFKDLDSMYTYVSNEEVMKFERDIFTYDELKNLFNRFVEKQVFFACILKDTDQMIGHLYFGRTFPLEFNEYSLGYIFHPDYQNKGYCKEATKELIKDAFETKKAHRITAKCNPENIASYKVMEHIGFKKEGLLRKRCAFKKDQDNQPIYTDELVYGLLKEDLL